jgi:hypothetical protein
MAWHLQLQVHSELTFVNIIRSSPPAHLGANIFVNVLILQKNGNVPISRGGDDNSWN